MIMMVIMIMMMINQLNNNINGKVFGPIWPACCGSYLLLLSSVCVCVCVNIIGHLPFECTWYVFVDKRLVVGLQFLNVWHWRRFSVQVKFVEFINPW